MTGTVDQRRGAQESIFDSRRVSASGSFRLCAVRYPIACVNGGSTAPDQVRPPPSIAFFATAIAFSAASESVAVVV
jgi:hypothetical protein